jgi:hypothetical protein
VNGKSIDAFKQFKLIASRRGGGGKKLLLTPVGSSFFPELEKRQQRMGSSAKVLPARHY